MRLLALIALAAGLAGLAGLAPAQSPTPERPTLGCRCRPSRAVVELFTSQGCSSCPTADALLGKLAERDDIIALSLPVDYWDYLGWKDTLANPKFSERQNAYAKARGDGDDLHAAGGGQRPDACQRQRRGQDRGAIEKTAKTLAARACRCGCRREGQARRRGRSGAARAPRKEATFWLAVIARA